MTLFVVVTKDVMTLSHERPSTKTGISFHAECILKIFFCVFYFLSLLENNRSHTHTLTVFATRSPALVSLSTMSRLETIYPLFFSFLFRPNGSSPVTVYRIASCGPCYLFFFFYFSSFYIYFPLSRPKHVLSSCVTVVRASPSEIDGRLVQTLLSRSEFCSRNAANVHR